MNTRTKHHTFTVLGVPTPKGRPRVTRQGVAFTPKKTREAEESFRARSHDERPARPYRGPIMIDIRFVMPTPTGWPAWKRDHYRGRSHTSRPDLDNLVKLVLDAMDGEWWLDDKQVASVTARKVYGVEPQTIVDVWAHPPLPATKAEVGP